MSRKRSFAYIALAAVVGCFLSSGSNFEPSHRTLIGRLQVDRAGDRLGFCVLDPSGVRHPIVVPSGLIVNHNGLEQMQDRLAEIRVSNEVGQSCVTRLRFLDPAELASDADMQIRGQARQLRALDDLPKRAAGSLPLAVQLAPKIAMGATLSTVTEPSVVSLSDSVDGRVGARIYIDGDAGHYYLVTCASSRGLSGQGLAIDEVRENGLVFEPDGSMLDRRVVPIATPNGSFVWTAGSRFRGANGVRLEVLSASAGRMAIGVRPMISASPWIVTNTNDSGVGSLRNAIIYHNANPTQQVLFKIPNTDPNFDGKTFTIKVTGQMAQLTAGTKIDADQQKAFTGDTNPIGPEIYLDGTNADPGVAGLNMSGGSCMARNLGIVNFGGHGLVAQGTLEVIQRCAIGIAPDGVTPAPNGGNGIHFVTCDGSQIGGNAGYGNVVSGNKGAGIFVLATKNLRILGNRVGVTADGTAACGNKQSGINIDTTSSVQIGSGTSGQGNQVSGNGTYGIVCNSSVTKAFLYGNLVGTSADGLSAIPNASVGILLYSSASIVGGAGSLRNIISGNTGATGLFCSSGSNNVIKGNWIGVDATGQKALPNYDGIYMFSTPGNVQIGGPNAGDGNVVSGNSQAGINFGASCGTGNVIQGNIVGTNPAGTAAVPNGYAGMMLTSGSGTQVGGTASGEGNLVSGNAVIGIYVSGSANGTKVYGNRIGVDVDGTHALPNGEGVEVNSGAVNTQIGSPTPGAPNIICGNKFSGIVLVSSSSSIVQSNWIGVNSKSALIPNEYVGVYISSASNNTIGGTGAGERNVICGNLSGGVLVASTGATGNIIRGNLVGTDDASNVGLGNQGAGIDCRFGANNTVVEKNTVVAGYIGLNLVGPLTGCQVNDNLIGTNGATTIGLGNTASGVRISNGAQGNQIGNLVGNVICGNGEGVVISDAGTKGNVVVNNWIGVFKSGINRPNTGAQVRIMSGAMANTIGSPTRRNLIGAYTGFSAIVVVNAGSIDNNLRGNSFLNGGKLNIDLVGNDAAYGFTPNDAMDADTGPNQLQNFPAVVSAVGSAGTVTVSGKYQSKANLTAIIDIYGVTASNSAGHGGAMAWLGSVTVTTDAAGNATFSKSVPLPSGVAKVCLQATAASSDSSEIGANAVVTAP